MTKVERIFHLAEEVAASYDLLNARRAGSGNSYTREVVNHLKLLVIEEYGTGVANQFLSKANCQSVDFWLEDEQTIVEVEYSMWSADPLLEKEVFKALLAKDAGRDVRHLILIGDPGSVRRWEAPTPRAVMHWVERHHQIRVQIWELTEKGALTSVNDLKPEPRDQCGERRTIHDSQQSLSLSGWSARWDPGLRPAMTDNIV